MTAALGVGVVADRPSEKSAAADLLHIVLAFSNKDDETGFLYYGFRFYRADLGRWLS
jgi:hypothetical protein